MCHFMPFTACGRLGEHGLFRKRVRRRNRHIGCTELSPLLRSLCCFLPNTKYAICALGSRSRIFEQSKAAVVVLPHPALELICMISPGPAM